MIDIENQAGEFLARTKTSESQKLALQKKIQILQRERTAALTEDHGSPEQHLEKIKSLEDQQNDCARMLDIHQAQSAAAAPELALEAAGIYDQLTALDKTRKLQAQDDHLKLCDNWLAAAETKQALEHLALGFELGVSLPGGRLNTYPQKATDLVEFVNLMVDHFKPEIETNIPKPQPVKHLLEFRRITIAIEETSPGRDNRAPGPGSAEQNFRVDQQTAQDKSNKEWDASNRGHQANLHNTYSEAQ